MKFSLNKLWIGILIGILAPVISLLMVYNSKYETLSFMEFIDYIKRIGVYTKLLSICVIPNIFFFFVLIWRKYLAAAKGVLVSTIVYAVLVILLMYVF